MVRTRTGAASTMDSSTSDSSGPAPLPSRHRTPSSSFPEPLVSSRSGTLPTSRMYLRSRRKFWPACWLNFVHEKLFPLLCPTLLSLLRTQTSTGHVSSCHRRHPSKCPETEKSSVWLQPCLHVFLPSRAGTNMKQDLYYKSSLYGRTSMKKSGSGPSRD